MSATYNPTRQLKPIKTDDPIEVALVYNVRPCGTCKFFWPDNPNDQSYGPYPTYDFLTNFPKGNEPKGTPEAYPWMKVKTQEQGFPNGEVMDGCRKTPIMTIGINPNMTAFAPGRKGTSWAYPLFSDDDHTNAFAKYAYYYRYRNVYQERFDFDVVKKYLLKDSQITATKSMTVTEDQIIAAKNGKIKSADRPGAGPTFDLVVTYEGGEEVTITLERDKGAPRYVLLFDKEGETSEFKAGDVIAAKLDVPAGQELEVYQELQTYYEQFVPTLNAFSDFLKKKGHKGADLAIGEDVGQLDMVACASPHWKPSFLGGTEASENLIISNCVSLNAWAMKQLVMTRPAVLFLVGESSYNMFKKFFGNLIHRDPPISDRPSDFAFTLFSETVHAKHPAYFQYETKINGRPYSIKTRIIVTPHFSFDQNFVPQIRLSKYREEELEGKYPACFKFLKGGGDITYHQPEKDYSYRSFSWTEAKNPSVLKTLENDHAAAWAELKWDYYNPHEQMAAALENLYDDGVLSYHDGNGKEKGYLNRTEGSCQFCVNKHWTFPEGCPYDKNKETPPPPGFLEAVVEEMIQKGKPKTQ